MNTQWLELVRGKDKPDLIIMSHDIYSAYEESLQDLQRYGDVQQASVGFEALKYKTASVIFDNNSNFGTTAEKAYFLNTDYLGLVQHPHRGAIVAHRQHVTAGRNAGSPHPAREHRLALELRVLGERGGGEAGHRVALAPLGDEDVRAGADQAEPVDGVGARDARDPAALRPRHRRRGLLRGQGPAQAIGFEAA